MKSNTEVQSNKVVPLSAPENHLFIVYPSHREPRGLGPKKQTQSEKGGTKIVHLAQNKTQHL